jgi:multiple sugar transport system substrate-binding protein
MHPSSRLSRRRLLAGLVTSAGVMGLLAACGGGASATVTTAGSGSQVAASSSAAASPSAAASSSAASSASAATATSTQSAASTSAAAASTAAASAAPEAANAAGTIRVALAGLDIGENVPGNSYEKYETEMAGGAGHDVYHMETKQLPAFGSKGVFTVLDPYIARSKVVAPSDYFYTPWSKSSLQGKMLGIPWDTAPAVLFYSKDLFQKAGLTPPPTDWSDKTWTRDAFLETATKLTTGSGVNSQYGYYQSTWWVYGFPWLWSDGGHVTDQNETKATLTDTKVVDTWQFLQDLMWKYKVWPSAQEATQGAASMFLTGKIGMYINGPYFIPALRNGKATIQWDVAVIPSGAAGRWTRDPADAVCIWKGSKLQDASWDFIEYLCGPKGELMLGQGGYVPVRKEVAQSNAFLQHKGGVNWKVIVDGLDHEGVQPVTDVWTEMDNTLTQAIGGLYTNNKQTAKDVLTKLQPQIQSMLDQAKVRRERPTYSSSAGGTSAPAY